MNGNLPPINMHQLCMNDIQINGKDPFLPDNEDNTKRFVLKLEDGMLMHDIQSLNIELLQLFRTPSTFIFARRIMKLDESNEVTCSDISYRLMKLSCPKTQTEGACKETDPESFKVMLRIKGSSLDEDDFLIRAVTFIEKMESSSEISDHGPVFRLNIKLKDVDKIPSIACYFALKSICSVIENAGLFLKDASSKDNPAKNLRLSLLIHAKRLSNRQYVTEMKNYVTDLLNELSRNDSKEDRQEKVNELLETGITPVSVNDFEQYLTNTDGGATNNENIETVSTGEQKAKLFYFQGKFVYLHLK